MPRTVRVEITAELSPIRPLLAYVTSPETHSRLVRIPQGKGSFTDTVEIEVLDTERYPEGSNPPFEIHTLVETWPRDRLVVESSAGLTQRAIRSMFPELYASDDEYARQPTPMVAPVAHRLELADRGPVRAMEPVDDPCGWCGEPMRALLDLDLSDPALAFLGLDGARLRVVTCHGCTCYAVVYTEIDLGGGARWAPDNPPSADVYASPPWGSPAVCSFSIAHALTHPDEVEPPAGDEQPTRLGGRPLWVQYWAYPACPRCGMPMPFLGQVDLGDPPWDDEGTYFAFVDVACGLAATVYQQT